MPTLKLKTLTVRTLPRKHTRSCIDRKRRGFCLEDQKEKKKYETSCSRRVGPCAQVSIYLLLVTNICVYLLTIVPLVLLRLGKYSRELVVTHTREAAKFMAIAAICTFLRE